MPGRAGVSATYYLVPHLTHRVHIYEFPNPWVVSNWGVHGERPPKPSNADYLVVDTNLLGDKEDLYQRLVTTEFKKVFDRDGIVVAKRVRRA